MRKGIILTLLTALLLLSCLLTCAAAEEAPDLTSSCTFKVSSGKGRLNRLTDGDYRTYWESSESRNPYVEITSETPMYGLYLCFQKIPDYYELQIPDEEGNWVTFSTPDMRFHHVYYPLQGATRLRIDASSSGKTVMGFNEVFVLGSGEVPDWVQRWEPTPEKADILFLAAHPDDELLFFGGAIPTYAVERKNRVVVAYLSYSNTTRRSEALNGLWSMGVRNYPVFGHFRDAYSRKLQDAYEAVKKGGTNGSAGKKEVWTWMTALFRQYKPEVVVTHDLDGEYGHGQHIMTADAAIECYAKAADPSEYPESAAQYGTWQIKKLYIHLYGDETNQTAFDWNQPLASLGGKTGLQAASDAYKLHVTQAKAGFKQRGVKHIFSVEETGGEDYFPNTVFGLYFSEVGPDTAHDDFLEHIEITAPEPQETEASETGTETATEPPEEQQPAETPEPAKTEQPEEEPAESAEPADDSAPEETSEPAETVSPAAETETSAESGSGEKIAFPVSYADVTAPEWADVTLNSRGFLDEGEYVLEDEENGHYMYVSETLRVVIERSYEERQIVQDHKRKNTHFYAFTANIWCDVGAGELPTVVFADPAKPKSTHQAVKITARENRVVFATSTDYYTYRIHQSYGTGIEVRNGEIFFDDPNKKPPKMPNNETLALYPDGHAESYPGLEKSAQEYINDGAYEVFTFGPCLVRDGQVTEYVNTANEALNPRYALGVVEPGHYVAVLCEGRVARSNGAQIATLAEMMQERGCQIAVNLDGGQTAVFAFMGKQINEVVKTDPNGRPQAEILAFGTSDLVQGE